MERTITVIATNSNSKNVFTSSANTLGELKAEMSAHGIDYAGMDFIEGVSRTTMIDDASVLPTNIEYKGRVTNNLVFMLSTTNKNIASGADRLDLYKEVKNLNLQDAIKEKFGKNFTQCSSAILEDFINQAKSNKKSAAKVEKAEIPTDRKSLYEYIKTNNLQDFIVKVCGNNYTRVSTECLYNVCKKATRKPANATKETVKETAKKPATKKAVECPFSDSELDNIIKGLRR